LANNLIQIKRTSVSGRAANTTTLTNPGELALNMTDGIMYSTNGSVVFEIGANNTNVRVTNTIYVQSIATLSGDKGLNGQVLTTNGSIVYWSNASANGVTNLFPTGDYGDLSTTIDAFGVSTVAGYECNAPGSILVVDLETPPQDGVPM